MTEESTAQAAQGCDAFVSYASQDAAVANSIVESLESQGLKCWLAPRDVKPGAEYADAIVRAITDAKALVLVMSGSAIASAHVGREVERAASKHKRIIAFKIDAAPLSAALEYFLSQSQWIDVPALGMKAALAKLAEAVGQGPVSSAPAIPPISSGGITQRIAIAAAVIVALGVAVGSGLYLWKTTHGGAQVPSVAAITDKSIAVLPFVDMSEKKDQEYFGDGMAEEILDLLVKVPGLKVIGRTSSFQFKGQTQDLRTIGEKLGAHYVLEGSVRKSGDRLRVTAQLINSLDGTHLWSQTYDRELSDVLKMQDEIAIKVVHALQIEVSPTFAVPRPALRNTEAYTLYLQGMHAGDRFEPQGWEQAVNDFKRALDLDPSFTEAAAAAAGTYQYGGQVGYVSRDVAFEKTRQFAELALKIDPHFVAAHALLGSIYGSYAWDWPAADREIKEALSLAPDHPETLWAATVLSLTLGRWDDGVKFAIAMQEVNPLDPDGYFWLSYAQMGRGRLAEAEAGIRRALELTPTYTYGPYTLGLVLLARNRPQAALEAFLKEPSEGGRLNGSALAYFALGRKADSDAALAHSLKRKFIFSTGIAAIYAYRGESDDAFKWLDRAYAEKDPLLYAIEYRTEFDKLHDDPRYKAFLKKMNLPE
jgi:TolB-like protein/tetratricopeptide (TPR) repeat protein